MPLDPVIAQGFRGIQLQDPLEQYVRVNQLLQAQQQNQLNALKMQEYQREREAENKLAQLFQRPGADPASPEFMREIYSISPLKGAAFQKSALETQKAQREAAEAEDKRKKAASDLAASYVKQARDQLPMVSDPQTYAAWRTQTLQRLPGFESLIPTDYSPEIVQRLALDADKMLERHFVTQNLGGGQQVVSMPKYGGGSSTVVPGSFAADVPLPPAVEAQRIRVAQASRPLREPRPEAPPRTQQVTMNDGTIGIMNMDTGQVTPASLNGARVKGKPSAFAEKTAAQRKQLGLDLDRAIAELTDAAKDGGLIDQSTGSGFGRLVDVGAGFVGEATPGAIAAGKLAPIADLALKMVPRFEGPQSNKDTASYKEAAGQLADSTLPNKIRKAAAKTVVRLMRERKNQFASPEMVSSGAAQDTGVDTNNPLLK